MRSLAQMRSLCGVPRTSCESIFPPHPASRQKEPTAETTQGRSNPRQEQPKAEAAMPLVCRIKGLEEQSCMVECMLECWE